MVTITYGYKNGYFTDCDNKTNWNETESGLTSALTVENDDAFKIEGTCDNVADEYAYYEKDITDISSDIYSKFMVRYKTSESASGLGAKVVLVFTSGTQTILDTSFSTTWAVAAGDVTAGKTIDKIRFYADDDPDSLASGTYQVYYDFIILHKGTFPLPHTGPGGMDLDPLPRYVPIGIPGRVTDITQNLGSESAVIRMPSCDLDQGTWKRTGDSLDGEVFLDIAHNSTGEPWQWLNTGSHQFKVTVHPRFYWRNNGDGSTSRLLDLTFKEYSLSDKSNETYAERFGI